MASYADDYKDYKYAQELNNLKYAFPEIWEKPLPYEEKIRVELARGRQAAAELRELRTKLRDFGKLLV